jgi:GNAT superfamily N-acetyltransferase
VNLDLQAVPYDDDLAAVLIDEIQLDLASRYGGPDETPVDPSAFVQPAGVFLLAYADGELIGCAGLRRFDRATVELKRMYIRAPYRRQGHARRLLAGVEDRARWMGYQRLVLETGLAQPEAIALYESAGYLPVPGFGHYADQPLSRSYGKDLG